MASADNAKRTQLVKEADVASPWMDDKEAAAYLKITPRVIRDRAKKKLLPAHEIPSPGRNRIFRFRREELDACLMGEWRPKERAR